MLTRNLLSWKRWNRTKETYKKTINFLIFLAASISLYASATQTLGIETFLDSFDKPENYILVEEDESFLIIQKINLQEPLEEKDIVLYYDKQGSVEIDEIQKISAVGSFKTYYLNNKANNRSIFQNQIIGKVIKKVDNNLLNAISLKIWDLTIHSLNIKKL